MNKALLKIVLFFTFWSVMLFSQNMDEKKGNLLATAYNYEKSGYYFDAFRTYQKALENNPGNSEAIKGYVRNLEYLGMPYLAYEYVKSNPGLFIPRLSERLRSTQASFWVRWGKIYHPDESKRFEDTDIAIDKLDKLIDEMQKKGISPRDPGYLRVKFDRMVALRNRFRMDEVIKEYEQLNEADRQKLPYYSYNALADAYLYKRNPETAFIFYQKALKLNPNYFESKVGVFYCYVEMFKMNKAIKWADKVNKEEPAWMGGVDNPYENEYKVEAMSIPLLGRHYANYNAKAQKGFESLSSRAPANIDLHAEVANVYRDRGWPRKAIDEALFGLAVEPNHPGLQNVMALALLDTQRYKESEKLIKSLYERYPEALDVQKSKKLWDIHNMRELYVEGYHGIGGPPQLADKSYSIDARLYASPMNYYWRPFLITYFGYGRSEDGTLHYNRYGVGLEYSRHDITANIGVVRNDNIIDDTSFFVDGRYEYNDYLSFEAGYDDYSKDTPIRALQNGITAHRGNAKVIWRASESRETTAEYSYMDFSDGNRRKEWGLSHYEKVITGPYYNLNATLTYLASKNTLTGTPYFNPSRDRYTGIELENVHHVYQWYSNRFSHALAIGFGKYWQEGFGTNSTGEIRYEHQWEYDDRFELIYGIARGKNYYDGVKEFETAFYFTLDWRF